MHNQPVGRVFQAESLKILNASLFLCFRWIPFGGGPRTCVGKEFARLQFKIFIIEFIRHFSNLKFANGKPPKMFAVPFLHPTDGLPIKLVKRELT